jgi:tetratricopeptide (TPR) repeat protein
MKNPDKVFTDLHRLLETQNFKSEKELREFMDSLMGKPIPSFPKEVLSDRERAQDLVFEAYELPLHHAKKRIDEALRLDPDCIEAYELLAETQRTPATRMQYYKAGIDIGRRVFDAAYRDKHKGMFWGMHETRPFMRCMQHYADCLYAEGKKQECVALLEELIELNPNDNQGVRDQLMLYLIEANEDEKFWKYAKEFDKDVGAFPYFNRALFAFKREGQNAASSKLLKRAIEFNKFVPAKLCSAKPIKEFPEMYGFGDENEALYYAVFARQIWLHTIGAMAWLRDHAKI